MIEFHTFRHFKDDELVDLQKVLIEESAKASLARDEANKEILRLQEVYNSHDEKCRQAESNLTMLNAELIRRKTVEITNR